MKKSVFWVVVAVVGGVVFGRCSGTGHQGAGLLSSSGRSSEVLIVCSDKQWKGTLGDSLQAILMQSVLGLPQDEPLFTLTRVSENYFKDAYKKHRNIIHFITDPSIDEPKVAVNHNTWAQPQLLVRIHAKNEQQAAETLSKYQTTIIKHLFSSEMKRFQRAQRSRQNFHQSSEIERLFKFSIVIPDGFIFAVKSSNFVWLRKDTKDWTQNLMIYTEPYTDTNQFKNEYIVRLRNTHTKQYVFGSADSSYMIVDERYIPSISEYFEFEAGYTVRTVGVFKMVKDFMGGPFVSMTVLEEKTNRIVTIDGFLYAPSDNKRDFLRQLESILLSVKFEKE